MHSTRLEIESVRLVIKPLGIQSYFVFMFLLIFNVTCWREMVFKAEHFNPASLIFLVFGCWIFLMAGLFPWIKEDWEVQSMGMMRRWTLGPFCWTSHFKRNEVSNLRRVRSRNFGLKFEVNGKSYGAGLNLSSEEAGRVEGWLREHFSNAGELNEKNRKALEKLTKEEKTFDDQMAEFKKGLGAEGEDDRDDEDEEWGKINIKGRKRSLLFILRIIFFTGMPWPFLIGFIAPHASWLEKARMAPNWLLIGTLMLFLVTLIIRLVLFLIFRGKESHKTPKMMEKLRKGMLLLMGCVVAFGAGSFLGNIFLNILKM